MQKRAVEILKDNPDLSMAEVMRRAGYKPTTSGYPKENFLALKGTQVALDQWREVLRGRGLGEEKLISKYQEWIDAQKTSTSFTEPDKITPDYATQVKAGEWLRKDLGIEQPVPSLLQQFNVGGKMELEFIGQNENSSQ